MRGLLFVLALAGAAPALRAQAPVVDSIAIVTEDIFGDAETTNVLFGIANVLHVKTRTGVVRRELLFAAGQPYDSAAVAETARNLRRLGIFRDVTIDSLRMDGRLVVRVRTADGWSTSLDVGAGSTGDEFTWNAGLFENNLFGTATRAGVSYRQETDRTAWRLSGTIRRLGQSRIAADGFYDALSDGYRWRGSVGVPFRAYQDPRALGIETDGADRRLLLYRDGVQSGVLRQRLTVARLAGAVAVRRSGTGYVRLGAAAQVGHHELVGWADTSMPAPATPDSVRGAVGVNAEWLASRFQVVRYFNGFGREEDLDLSFGVRAGVWAAPRAFGYEANGVGPWIEAQAGVPFGPHFARVEVEARGLLANGGIDSATVVGTVTIGLRPLPRHSTVLFVRGGAEERPYPSFEFDLGSRRGPRAFQAHAFTGDRMIWGTIEHRWFLADDLLHLLGVGVAAFADWGGAWYRGEVRRTGGDVGLGLRLGPSRASGLNVGRFDLAWRWGDGVGSDRWVFSFGRAFPF